MQSISNYASSAPGVSHTPDDSTDIRSIISEQYDSLVFFDGLDSAIVGVAEVYTQGPVVCYDRQLCLEALMDSGAMTWDEALEYFDFNVACAFVGPQTPAFLDRYQYTPSLTAPPEPSPVSAPSEEATTPPTPRHGAPSGPSAG